MQPMIGSAVSLASKTQPELSKAEPELGTAQPQLVKNNVCNKGMSILLFKLSLKIALVQF